MNPTSATLLAFVVLVVSAFLFTWKQRKNKPGTRKDFSTIRAHVNNGRVEVCYEGWMPSGDVTDRAQIAKSLREIADRIEKK